LAVGLSPPFGVVDEELLARIRFALLKAAISVHVDGVNALQRCRDPIEGTLFEHRQTIGGFVLSSKFHRGIDRLELRVEPLDESWEP
jgi:hypothetical protein